MKNLPFVSVIVPVFNDCKRLKLCLAALFKQTYGRDHFEIIVVDNGKNEGIEDVVSCFINIILVKEPKPGSYSARNKGILSSKGGIFAFTDSDCIPSKGWIENGVKMFLMTDHCGLVAGDIKYCFRDDKGPKLIELCDTILYPMNQEVLVLLRRADGANIFTSREVIDKIGMFNEALKSGGDDELAFRVYQHGYQHVYASNARVLHFAKDSFRGLLGRAIRFAGAEYSASKFSKNTISGLSQLESFGLFSRTKQFIGNLRNGVFKNDRVRSPFLMLPLVLLVQIIISLFKCFEYVRLAFGKEPSR